MDDLDGRDAGEHFESDEEERGDEGVTNEAGRVSQIVMDNRLSADDEEREDEENIEDKKEEAQPEQMIDIDGQQYSYRPADLQTTEQISLEQEGDKSEKVNVDQFQENDHNELDTPELNYTEGENREQGIKKQNNEEQENEHQDLDNEEQEQDINGQDEENIEQVQQDEELNAREEEQDNRHSEREEYRSSTNTVEEVDVPDREMNSVAVGKGKSEYDQELEEQWEKVQEGETKDEETNLGVTAAAVRTWPIDEDEGKKDEPVKKKEKRISNVVKYANDATATVRFLLMPSQQVATLRCLLNQTLSDLKLQFSNELKIAPDVILLLLDGKKLKDSQTLGALGVCPNGTIQLQMQSADPVNQPIKQFRPRQEYHMPDVITVRVPTDSRHGGSSGYRDVVVEIERSATSHKPFLGGYRHKQTAVEYHHASAQTAPPPRPPSHTRTFCRDTQTTEQHNAGQQTANHTSTQMSGVAIYVSSAKDRLLAPGRYISANEHLETVTNKTIVIQKYFRRWAAKRRVAKIRKKERERKEWEQQQEEEKKAEKEDRMQKEYQRRMNPKTKEDFDLLYHALEQWRLSEIDRINSTLSGAERKAALCQLLDQEAELLGTIERHKSDADSENKAKRINDFLNKTSEPKKWEGPNGKTTAMDTPYTLRAQQLKDIYRSLTMNQLTPDERLDVLLTLKKTVEEHDCKLTQEIIALIDREADLQMRGVSDYNLEGLRKRITTLFLQYIKTPTFNPEAARLLKVPQDGRILTGNTYFCPSCSQYLPSTDFHLSSNSKSITKCRKCEKKTNDACKRQDYSNYRYLLKNVCHSEESLGQTSTIAYLMQESDIYFLVENIWGSQSALSAWEDLYDLVLVRWDRNVEWSPWNCVLLTKDEASAHYKLENFTKAYGAEFVHRVAHKHTLARAHFARVPRMAEYMRTRSAGARISKQHSATGLSSAAIPHASQSAHSLHSQDVTI